MEDPNNPSKETLENGLKIQTIGFMEFSITTQKTNAFFLLKKLHGWVLQLISPIQNQYFI